MSKITHEHELYEPVAAHFRNLGYQVKAEVNDCDVIAHRIEEEPIIIELKKSFSIELLIQAAKRQKISPRVFVAVPSPQSLKRAREWRYICESMRIGLILIKLNTVEICATPPELKTMRQNRKKKALLNEFQQRQNDWNVGGTTRQKRYTVYREHAVRCASVIAEHPESYASATEIRKATQLKKAAKIVRDNVYGWFERIPNPESKTMPKYQLTEIGKKEWAEWKQR
jgi:hypothetical protein